MGSLSGKIADTQHLRGELSVKNGVDGIGIASIEQTKTAEEDGGVNIITVTMTDKTKQAFQVKNGSKGPAGEKGEQGPAGTDATVTATNIQKALGYKPADETKISQLEEEIVNLQASGISSTVADLLVTLFENAVYTSDMSATITALREALRTSGESGGENDNTGDSESGGSGSVETTNENVVISELTATDDGNGNVTVLNATATDDGNGNVTVIY